MSRPRWIAHCVALLLSLTAQAHSQGQIMTGPAQAVDGDSLEMTGISIRLFGVDAAEALQTCQRGTETWACGQEAKTVLSQLVAGKELRCEQRDRDRYGRIVASCYAGQIDLAQAMVAAGLAIALPAFSTAYVDQETRARQGKLGLWGSVFDTPAAWRAAHPRQETAAKRSTRLGERAVRSASPARLAAPSTRQDLGCTIKGNRNRRGEWIYHLPGMPYYDATRAEEMFCSEAQARAAGYRRAIVRR